MKMKFAFRYLVALFSYFIFACEKEEIEPISEPKLSSPSVDISSNSFVEFSATVIDYGNQPILEYGFLYADSDDLDFEKAEVVSKKGNPEKQFKLKASQALIYGKMYYSAAFLITRDTVVLSKFISFVPKGSAGFILDRINGPSEIYFGDTLTFFGSNLSSNPNNYNISVSGSPTNKMTIIEIKDNYFKAILPQMFSTIDIHEKGVLKINFDIGGKGFQADWPAKFKEPIFSLIPSQKVNFEGEVTILGDYLDSDIKAIRFLDEPYFDVEIVSWEKKKIIFKAKRPSPNKNEAISIHIRRKVYEFENAYSYISAEFHPGQEISGNLQSYQDLNGTNFILAHANYNKVISEPSGLAISGIEVTEKSLKVVIHESVDKPTPRVSYLSMFNADVKSENQIKFTCTSATLNYSLHGDFFGQYNDMDLARGVTINGKTFLIWRNKINEYNASERSVRLILTQPISSHNLAGVFAIPGPNGKIYMGSHNKEYYWEYIRIFEFDPVTEQIKELPRPPYNVTSPKYVYVEGQYLNIDGGFSRNIYIDNEIKDMYRFDLNENKWEKLEMEATPTGMIESMKTFYFKGKLFAIGRLLIDQNLVLQEYNSSSQKWITIKSLSAMGGSETSQPIILDSDLYVFGYSKSFKINLDTFIETEIDNIYRTNDLRGTIISNGKIYTFYGEKFLETDPLYLTK